MNRHRNKPHLLMSIETIKLRIAFTLLFTCLLFPTFAQSSTNLDLSDAEKEHLSAKGRVTMCVDPNWMPYERIDEQGKHEGIAADFMSEFQKGIPVPIELVLTESWKESLEAAKSRQCDILSLLNESPQRREFLNFTDPYLTDSVVIAVRNDVFYLEGLESLSGRKLGIVEGYVYEEKIRKQYPEIKIISVKSVGDGLRKVSDGEIYATLDALFIITRHLQELGLSNLKIVGQTGLDNAFRVGVRKDDPILLSVFDKIIKNLDDATRNAILGRWYTVKFQHGTDWRVVWQVTGIAIIILCLLGYNTLLTRRFNRKLAEANELQLNKNLELDKRNIELQDEITQRKKAEDRFRLAAETVTDLIYEWNIFNDTLLWFGDIDSALGYTPGEFPHTIAAWMERLHPDDFVRLSDAVERHRTSTEPINYEYQIQRKDGSWLYWSACAVPVLDENGNPIKWIGNCADITERKRNDQKLIKSEKKINRLKRMESLGLLAGGVAHDLNNILSGIVSYPELLLLENDLSPKHRKAIEIIHTSGNKAATIVADLLTIARGVATDKKTLNINSRISEYLHSPEHQKLIQYHPTITIKTFLDPDLLYIKGSSVHIDKIVMNLVSNATEAVASDGNITISTMNRYLDRPFKGYDEVNTGEYVVLSVSDDGPGIPKEDLERIFEPFYSKKVLGRSGTGLGLTVVWNTLQDHNGYIDIESSGNGTTINVYLPITRDKKISETLESTIEELKGNGQVLLIVDDEKHQRVIASDMAVKLGYKVEAVASGEDAIAYLQENTVDLILLDMIMDPGINGRETYERIVKIHPHQKAIITSGFSETEEVKEALKLGIAQYIKKPYSIKKIAKAIKDELG